MGGLRITHHVSRFAPHALLALVPALLLAPIVFGGQALFWGVPLMQFYPWQHFAAETWRMGEAPLWNPLLGNGAPLAANLQTGAFYPLNFLYLFLPTETAMGYTAALHVALAGLFMFAFMRSLGLRALPSLIAALAFQLSGFLIARLGFLSITAALPWVAAWLWRAERVMQSGRVSDALWLAAIVGLGLLAGHAQTALYGLILLAGYVVYRAKLRTSELRATETQSARRKDSVFSVSPWLIGLSGILLGVGLAAVQLLPAAELARESQRAGGLDYTFAMTHSYWPWRLLTLLAPDVFGNPSLGNFWGYDNYWENAAYIGVLPLGLVLVAIRDTHHASRITPFFLAAALVSLIFALGWFTPIYPFLFRAVPGFSLFQGPARWLSVFTIALCALAGFGAESMLRGRGNLRRGAVWIAIGVALIGAGIASRGFLAGRTATFADATLRLGVWVTTGGLLFGLRPPADDRRFRLWAGVLVAVVAIDLLTAHAGLNPTIDPALYRLPAGSAQALRGDGQGRVFMFDADDETVRKQFGIALPFADFGPSTLERWLPFRESLIANTSMIGGAASANNFDSLLVGYYVQLRDAINAQPFDTALRLLSLMHVRYIASPRELGLPVVHRSEVATIYRNEAALPRAWIVPSARLESDPLAAILDPAFDPRGEVILDASLTPADAIRDTQDAVSHTLISLRDTPNTVTIRAASEADGYLVLADTWYPGWRATLDGRAVSILRANVAFRAIAFPAGEHNVEFRYEPDSFRIGAGLSAISALLIAAGLIFSMGRRR